MPLPTVRTYLGGPIAELIFISLWCSNLDIVGADQKSTTVFCELSKAALILCKTSKLADPQTNGRRLIWGKGISHCNGRVFTIWGSFIRCMSPHMYYLTPTYCVVFIHLLFGIEVSDSESFTGLWRRIIDTKEV